MKTTKIDPVPIANEIIDIFAKYQIPIMAKELIYKTIDSLLETQIVLPVTEGQDQT